jgi:5-methyltetrahydrofolate--homocysteine methyltransferase
MNKLHSLLSDYPVILADGAMGTMLFEAGLEFGDAPEMWNLLHPEQVRAVHRQHLAAGAQLLLTNTFGGNRFRLKLHNLQDRVVALNRAAAENLRAEIDEAGITAVAAGDIGPTGEILAPLGEMVYEEAVAAFAEQAGALIAGGVDAIWIETMSSLEEVEAAVAGVRQVSADVPIITTMTFDTHGRTMMGVRPEQAARALQGFGAVAVGGNCGNGPEEILAVIEKMHAALPEAVLVAKANAGIPTLVEGKAVYGASPEDMARYARAVAAAGARIIGGCCGNSPAHLRAMAAALGRERGLGD